MTAIRNARLLLLFEAATFIVASAIHGLRAFAGAQVFATFGVSSASSRSPSASVRAHCSTSPTTSSSSLSSAEASRSRCENVRV